MMKQLVAGLCGLAVLGSAGARAGEAERVAFPSRAKDAAAITGYLYRPRTTAAATVPVVIALHGCGGLFNSKGDLSSRHADWTERLVQAGYAVLFPDSFGSRGFEEVCTTRDRTVTPRDRAGDAAAAAEWAARQAFADPARIALLGWSNGGSSVLWATGGPLAPAGVDYKTAIAFYPGCRTPAKSAAWSKPRLPLMILIGDADDWTPAEPCREIAARGGVRLIEYPGAVHGFDSPDAKRRTRTGLAYSQRGDGRAEVGTDPVARAAAIKEVMATLAAAFGG